MVRYIVRWTYRLQREVEASSRKEAIEICEEMGDINADTVYLPMRIVGVIE